MRALKRTPLNRKKPLQAKAWGVSTKPRKALAAVNVEQDKRRRARRAKQRNSPENKAARKEAEIRANGICECGCGLPFDTTWGYTSPDYPEFHHDDYKRPEGRMLRRQCHARIEMTQHPTRNRNYAR